MDAEQRRDALREFREEAAPAHRGQGRPAPGGATSRSLKVLGHIALGGGLLLTIILGHFGPVLVGLLVEAVLHGLAAIIDNLRTIASK